MSRSNVGDERIHGAQGASVRQAIDRLKAEHGVSETAAYAMLIRAAAGAWPPGEARPTPLRHPAPLVQADQTSEPASPRVPLQRTL
jgi:hypothetical protein